MGNRISQVENGINTSYTYNAVNELKTSTGTTYTYDRRGNLVQKVAGADTWVYTYDPANRLKEVKKNSTVLGTYSYDANGIRAKKVEGGQTTHYLALGHKNLYEKTGNVATKHIFAGSQRIAEVKDGVVSYYHNDHLGSSRAVTNASGVLIAAMATTPFGVPHSTTAPTAYRFTGKELDSTGLYYFAARYYEPSVGRFVTEDSWQGLMVKPSTQNRYVYVSNNPLRYTDPTGHWERQATLQGAGDGGVGVAVGVGIGETLRQVGTAIGESAINYVGQKVAQVGTVVSDIAGAIVNWAKQGSDKVGNSSSNGGNSTNPDPNDPKKIINPEKQARHLAESVEGTRSYLSSDVDAQQLLNEFGGKGHLHGAKETVNCGRVVGYWVDLNTGIAHETTRITIHYSKTGVHIVPAYPYAP